MASALAALRRSDSDFEQLSFLGSGAFGEVYKVRNKIDHQLYALKRIRVDQQRREKVLREARLLSSLTHPRIVRYYQCWIENVEEDVEEPVSNEASTSADDLSPVVGAAATPAAPVGAEAPAGTGDTGGPDGRRTAATPSPGNTPVERASPAIPASGVPPASATNATANAAGAGAEVTAAAVVVPAVSGTPTADGPLTTAANAGAATPGAPPAPRLVCNICSKSYLDWVVAFSAWSALDASLQPLNLCTDCYKLALVNMGFDLSRISITYRHAQLAADGSGTPVDGDGKAVGSLAISPSPLAQAPPPPPKKTVVASYLYIQTEFCERTLLEECVEIIDSSNRQRPSDNTAADGVNGSNSTGAKSAVISPQATARIWQLFWEIVEGLAYLHAANVVHRDLKPSNIFSKSGCAKIGDLGLATTITSAAVAGAAGTPTDVDTTDNRDDDGPTGKPSAGQGLGAAGGLNTSSPQAKTAGMGRDGPHRSPLPPALPAPPAPTSPALSVGGVARRQLGVVHEAEDDEDEHDEDQDGRPLRHGRGEGRTSSSRNQDEAGEGRSSSSGPFGNSPGRANAHADGAAAGRALGGGPAASPGHGPQGLGSAGGDRDRDRSMHRGVTGGLSQGVGTYFYMAPESLAHREAARVAAARARHGGRLTGHAGAQAAAVLANPALAHAQYSEKTDLYALGVILFEMFSAHRIANASQSDRARMLSALKRGAVPRSFMETFPVQTQLIANLMQEDPRARPTASDLLRYRYFVWAPSMVQAGLPIEAAVGLGHDGMGPETDHGHPSSLRPGTAQHDTEVLEAAAAALVAEASVRAPLSPSKASRFIHMNVPDAAGARAGGGPGVYRAEGGLGGDGADGQRGDAAAAQGQQLVGSLPRGADGRGAFELHTSPPASPRLGPTGRPIVGFAPGGHLVLHGVDLRTADSATLRSLLGQAMTTISEQTAAISQLKSQLAASEAKVAQLAEVLQSGAGLGQGLPAGLYGQASPAAMAVRGPGMHHPYPTASPVPSPLVLQGGQAAGVYGGLGPQAIRSPVNGLGALAGQVPARISSPRLGPQGGMAGPGPSPLGQGAPVAGFGAPQGVMRQPGTPLLQAAGAMQPGLGPQLYGSTPVSYYAGAQGPLVLQGQAGPLAGAGTVPGVGLQPFTGGSPQASPLFGGRRGPPAPLADRLL